ncbi:capsular polysaccharide export protein, LipB/KpsS family [Zhongshania aliphaticivorans]|uniref:capsular polysaccharide export protein, LipB/KpsS family n=1 Tax=Zhongshania aliphaticivorans TaxID=1470434 RepID=UPI0012E60755|nr:hypothetical protein [Zhongshania aliphaticivorans]CAA0100036.1 Uncharacterised protein [Zhongshania aliphaticivorans]
MIIRIPKIISPHKNIAFIRYVRRSNSSAAKQVLNLKQGSHAKTLLFTTINRTVSSHPALFNDLSPLEIHWSERHVGNAESKLVFEHGWLPRCSYQMSPYGANARSHVVFNSETSYMKLLGSVEFEKCKSRALRFVQSSNSLDIPELTDQPFCLVPLQGGGDFNLKFSESGFDYIFGETGANDKLASALLERIEFENPGIKIIVTEHPAKKCRLSKPLSLPKHTHLIKATDNIRSIDLAAHKNCAGIVSVNSNLMHEAMLKNKRVCAYGRLMYNQNDKPVYSNLEGMLNNLVPDYESKINNYLSMLFLNQWELTDFMDPVLLHRMFSAPTSLTPWEFRNEIT